MLLNLGTLDSKNPAPELTDTLKEIMRSSGENLPLTLGIMMQKKKAFAVRSPNSKISMRSPERNMVFLNMTPRQLQYHKPTFQPRVNPTQKPGPLKSLRKRRRLEHASIITRTGRHVQKYPSPISNLQFPLQQIQSLDSNCIRLFHRRLSTHNRS